MLTTKAGLLKGHWLGSSNLPAGGLSQPWKPQTDNDSWCVLDEVSNLREVVRIETAFTTV